MKTTMLCPACKEATLDQIKVLDDIDITGYSLLSDGSIGMEGLVYDSHHALFCSAEKRTIFDPRRRPVDVTRSTAQEWS